VEASRQRLVERAQGPMRVAAFAASKGGDGLAFLIHPNCRNERRMWRKAAI
jgi:hypothetical protein